MVASLDTAYLNFRFSNRLIVSSQVVILFEQAMLINRKVVMVGVKRKSALTGSGEGPSKKLRKTGQGSRMTIKEQKLAMFKRPKPVIPLDHIPS